MVCRHFSQEVSEKSPRVKREYGERKKKDADHPSLVAWFGLQRGDGEGD